jgi:hypothetical protein
LDSDFSKKIHNFSVRQDASAPSKAEGAPVAACASNRKPNSPIDNRQDSRAALRHLDVARKPGAHPDVGATRGDERLRRHGRAMSWPVNWTLPEHRQAMEIRVRGVHWLCLLEMR